MFSIRMNKQGLCLSGILFLLNVTCMGEGQLVCEGNLIVDVSVHGYLWAWDLQLVKTCVEREWEIIRKLTQKSSEIFARWSGYIGPLKVDSVDFCTIYSLKQYLWLSFQNDDIDIHFRLLRCLFYITLFETINSVLWAWQYYVEYFPCSD